VFVIRQELLARGAYGVYLDAGSPEVVSHELPARTPTLVNSAGAPSGVDQVLFRSPGYLSPQKEPGAKNIRAF